MVSELISKYVWLVQTFVKAGDNGLSLSEIQRKWESRWDSGYSRRSFNNHRTAIAEVFGIEIGCNRSTNRYFVSYGEDVYDQNADAAWMINTFTVNNLLSLSHERLTGRVSVENIPSGQRWLTSIMDAMLDESVIKISYRKYTSETYESLHVSPFGVKEVEKRWYLVGFCEEREAMRVYGLDRIHELARTDEKFSLPKDFSIDECFENSFGIYLPEGRKALTISFDATPREANYLRDLPIHHSQKLVNADNGDKERPFSFQIRVIPNDNLIMELCRHGDRIRVTGPQEIVDKVRDEHAKAMKLYKI